MNTIPGNVPALRHINAMRYGMIMGDDDKDFMKTGYRAAFSDYLSQATSLAEFKSIITKELKKLGASHWLYLRTDAPIMYGLKNAVTSLHTDQLNSLVDHKIWTMDSSFKFIQQNNKPVFRSDITPYFLSTPLVDDARLYAIGERIYLNMGLYDHYALPIVREDARPNSIFIIYTDKKGNELFVNQVKKYRHKINTISIAVDLLGEDNFNDIFCKASIEFEALKQSIPVKILELISIGDIGEKEASQQLDIPLQQLNHQMRKVKKLFNTTTIQAALIKAIQHEVIAIDETR